MMFHFLYLFMITCKSIETSLNAPSTCILLLLYLNNVFRVRKVIGSSRNGSQNLFDGKSTEPEVAQYPIMQIPSDVLGPRSSI